MKKLELYEIIKRELVWKQNKIVEEKYEYTTLGAVKSVAEATDIVNVLNRKNKNEQITYFYKDLEFDLYENPKKFFDSNSRHF